MRNTKKNSYGEVIYVSKALACDAGGPKKNGGHVFDRDGSDIYRAAAACRCGMDQMTYDTVVKHASWA